MSFSVPTFNLECNVYTGPWPSKVLRLIALPCNLASGRRVDSAGVLASFPPNEQGGPSLLVPLLSDVRDAACGGSPDIIECPLGSGRWYQVMMVDDVGKGFGNEYRMVRVIKAWQGVDPTEYAGLFWPVPIP